MSLSNIHLFRFNNYYNRIIKPVYASGDYVTVADMINAGAALLHDILSANFNPNDNVTTEIIINYDSKFNDNPDYLLEISDGMSSRWFVIDAVRTRNGQYRLTLKRDTIAENIDNVLDAYTFVEKGYINPTSNDPALFNSENMGFNQIKTSETKLFDKSQCGWIVGYVDRNMTEDQRIEFGIEESNADYTYESMDDLPDIVQKVLLDGMIKYDYLGLGVNFYQGSLNTLKNYSLRFSVNESESGIDVGYPIDADQISYEGRIYDKLTYGIYRRALPALNDLTPAPGYNYNNIGSLFANRVNSILVNFLFAATGVDNSHDSNEILSNYANRIFKIDGDLYTLREIHKSLTFGQSGVTKNSGLYYEITDKMNGLLTNGTSGASTISDFYTTYQGWFYRYEMARLTDIHSSQYNITIPKTSDRISLNDAPYDMFCMPYSDELYISNDDITSNKELNLKSIYSIATALGSKLYDLQLVPYCPLQPFLDEGPIFTHDGATGRVTNLYRTQDSAVVGSIYWCEKSNFTFNIEEEIIINNPKESNDLDMYRIVSPNGNGIYELDPAMNGSVNYFNVDCTYKPSSPYIHINPNFKNYFGQDFNDKRGLILGGDFSLPIVVSSWTEYQNQNKFYQEIFNRDIENQKLTNKWQMAQTIFGAVGGTISSTASGAVAGAMSGIPGAGIVGAGLSGVLSAAGGIADIAMTSVMQHEALDYKHDMYGYQLGNIKARPYSLSKISAFDENNKIVPFIEYYTCTDTERQAYRNKIKFNGMTIMRIDTLRNFINPNDETYLKGKLIRFKEINNMDFHEVNDLANEVNMGFFITI